MVGIYSNYQFIIAGITSLIAAFYEAITARVGQMLSMSEGENQYQGFLQFYSFINSGWRSHDCLFLLSGSGFYQDLDGVGGPAFPGSDYCDHCKLLPGNMQICHQDVP
ncbi:MAG: hypothetical protein ACLUGJ_11625 [Blautia wexlerae]